jgi:transketolase
VAQGWRRWIGDAGDSMSIERFGASAPYQAIYEHYGLTVEHVVARTLRLLGRGGAASGGEGRPGESRR